MKILRRVHEDLQKVLLTDERFISHVNFLT